MPALPRPRRILPLALLAPLACTPGAPPTPEPTLHIGVMVTLEEPLGETSGRPTVRGAEFAASEINQRGGVLIGGVPHRVELTIVDFADRTDAATTAARTLLNQPGIHALVGPQFSRHAIPVSNLAESAQVPMVSPMSSSAETTRDKRWVFRVAFTDAFQGDLLARLAVEGLGARRAAVLFERSSAYSKGLAELFSETIRAHGGVVVASESFTPDAREPVTVVMRRIVAADPEVLFLPNETPWVEAQLQAARSLGWDGVVLGSDTWDVDRVAQTPASEGAYVVDLWHPDLDTPAAVAFRERFEAQFGMVPKSSAAATYDAVTLIVQAAAREGRLSSEAIRDGLSGIQSFEGVTGSIRYAGTGDPIRSAVLVRLEQGRDRLVEVIDPESGGAHHP